MRTDVSDRPHRLSVDDRAARLLGYAAAAGAGAFAFGSSAEASIVSVDIPDFDFSTANYGGSLYGWAYFDIDQDGTRDLGIFRGYGYGGYTVLEVYNYYGGSNYPRYLSESVKRLSETAGDLDAFEAGDVIGPGAEAGIRDMTTAYGYNNSIETGNFIGFTIDLDGDGELNYGWIAIDVPGGFRTNVVVKGWAYQSEEGVAIEAGAVPAPGTLALLAAGAGAAGLRGRRKD